MSKYSVKHFRTLVEENAPPPRIGYFSLAEGETKWIRFNPGEGREPHFSPVHWIEGKKGNFLVPCVAKDPRFKEIGCIPCRSENRASGQYIFNIIDCTYYHVIKKKKKSAFEDCSGSGCSLCRKKHERRLRGAVYWGCSFKTATLIIEDLLPTLNRRCTCGGKISIVGWDCPKCDYEDDGFYVLDASDIDEDMDDEDDEQVEFPEVTKCPGCGKNVEPEEALECDKCSDPVRADLSDCYILVKRVDDTTYQFKKYRFKDLKEEHAELEPINLDKVHIAASKTEFIKRLQLPPHVENDLLNSDTRLLNSGKDVDEDEEDESEILDAEFEEDDDSDDEDDVV